MKTAELTYACPKCLSIAIERNMMANTGKCLTCGFENDLTEFVGHIYEHLSSGDEDFVRFVMDLQLVFMKSMRDYGKVLQKYGFLTRGYGESTMSEHLKLYVRNGSAAFVKSILSTRLEIEQELVRLANKMD